MALMTTLLSCNRGGSDFSVAEAYQADAYMNGRLDLFNQCPIEAGDIVMLGDDWFDQGLWSDFYDNSKIKNRGILGDRASILIARTDSIAAKKPAKVFVRAGINDICAGTSAKEVSENLKGVFARIAKLSPATALYYVNVVSLPAMSAGQVAEVASLNEIMAQEAKKGGYLYIDLCGAMAKGVADGTFSGNGGRYLNGAGFETYAKLLEEHVGSAALNRASDNANSDAAGYLERWYGACDPATCYPSDYYTHRVSVFRSLPVKEGNGVVLLGDSLTDYAEWREILAGFNFPIANLGIAGDMIEGMELRLDEVAAQKPNKIFIMAGCNDLVKNPDADPLTITERYFAIVKKARALCPKATLYVQGILPLNPLDPAFKRVNPAAEKINKALKEGAKETGYVFIDISTPLKNENGELRLECTTDGCHLNATGYFTWATELLQFGRMLIIGNPYKNEL